MIHITARTQLVVSPWDFSLVLGALHDPVYECNLEIILICLYANFWSVVYNFLLFMRKTFCNPITLITDVPVVLGLLRLFKSNVMSKDDGYQAVTPVETPLSLSFFCSLTFVLSFIHSLSHTYKDTHQVRTTLLNWTFTFYLTTHNDLLNFVGESMGRNSTKSRPGLPLQCGLVCQSRHADFFRGEKPSRSQEELLRRTLTPGARLQSLWLRENYLGCFTNTLHSTQGRTKGRRTKPSEKSQWFIVALLIKQSNHDSFFSRISKHFVPEIFE